MIRGVGVDICEIARLERDLARHPRLAERLFTPAERPLAVASLAARFAAKEAVAKALGSPGGMSWQDCEITKGPAGEPILRVTGAVAAAAAARGIDRWHLTLSHDGGMAVAFVIAESTEEHR
ncbi:MAG TPA: holo-ACP synthase [Actinomycetaceae bacterium]|nr:holo-ACP synthase [Actinomycetaceae bacterium]